MCEACGLAPAAGVGLTVLDHPSLAACPSCCEELERDPGGREAARLRIEAVEAALDEGRFLVVTAVVMVDAAGRILVAERHRAAHVGDVWEFPGGKAEPGETLSEAIVREIREEMELELQAPRLFFMADHRYPTFHIRLCTFVAPAPRGEPRLRDHAAVRWVPAAALGTVGLAGADMQVARVLAERPPCVPARGQGIESP
jgi:mutator protein MutT